MSCSAVSAESPARSEMKAVVALITIGTVIFLMGCPLSLGLDPSLEVSQYAHTAWTVRDGFSLGNIYAIAQTADGYLWLGSEFGLFRFDGVHAVQWQPPAGQQLPDRNINSLLVTRDGTLWIGTFGGLASLSRGKLSRPPAEPFGLYMRTARALSGPLLSRDFFESSPALLSDIPHRRSSLG